MSLIQFKFKLLDNLVNNSLYIQIWGQQKQPNPELMKKALPTKEYFEREKESGGTKTATNFIKNKVLLLNSVNIFY
jgi:hypothetical protein